MFGFLAYLLCVVVADVWYSRANPDAMWIVRQLATLGKRLHNNTVWFLARRVRVHGHRPGVSFVKSWRVHWGKMGRSFCTWSSRAVVRKTRIKMTVSQLVIIRICWHQTGFQKQAQQIRLGQSSLALSGRFSFSQARVSWFLWRFQFF